MKFRVKSTGEVFDFKENWCVITVDSDVTFNLSDLEPVVENTITETTVTKQIAPAYTDRSLKDILGGNKIKIEIE